MNEPPDAPKTEAEIEAGKLIRRQKRNMRKAGAEGFLAGVCAMLRPGDIALDCGANMGVVTRQLAATGADVIAYEPDPYAFGKLREEFDGTGNVELVNAAVGASDGTVQLMRADNFDENPAGASVKSTILAGGRSTGSGNAVDVPLVNFFDILDRLHAERGEITFVKMDIEGAELEILERMEQRQMFGMVRCLVAETHERKFKELRPRFRDLRSDLDRKYSPGHVNLDWI